MKFTIPWIVANLVNAIAWPLFIIMILLKMADFGLPSKWAWLTVCSPAIVGVSAYAIAGLVTLIFYSREKKRIAKIRASRRNSHF